MSCRDLRARTVALSIWGVGIVVGLASAISYQFTPAQSSLAFNRWPAATTYTLASDRPTLVMFVHPHCPCSRASVSELGALMMRCPGRLNAQVVFFKPGASATDWTRTALWESVGIIPGVERRIDFQGVEQRHFGALVSGEVFAYLPSGELKFHGGITNGRGHLGDNAGRSALESLLLHDEMPIRATPVFGCELVSTRARP